MYKLRLIGLSLLLLSGCSISNHQAEKRPVPTGQTAPKPSRVETAKSVDKKSTESTNSDKKQKSTGTASKPAENSGSSSQGAGSATNQSPKGTAGDEIHVVAKPASIPVLVNKQNKLPESYTPGDLVTTTVPFISTATSEKRKMRKEAADALAEMFAAAKQQGITLLGVSAYRSHATQTSLFNYYVNADGYNKARTYSALPGTSEHETGLAIDVTGGNGKCAADDCFGGTPEAEWLQDHAAEFGFIVRYPKGKEAITGYKYEPWHIRYVGKEVAAEIMDAGITLEEYTDSQPVNN